MFVATGDFTPMERLICNARLRRAAVAAISAPQRTFTAQSMLRPWRRRPQFIFCMDFELDGIQHSCGRRPSGRSWWPIWGTVHPVLFAVADGTLAIAPQLTGSSPFRGQCNGRLQRGRIA